MAPAADIDLYAPFERDTILEIRTGQMQKLSGTTIPSAIDKQLCAGRVPVSFLGLEADEHDPTFHGGKDKAIHGYCSAHYAQWRREYPEAETRFQPGGFGENFVTASMNERNVCIGDIMAVGDGDDGLLLQVSLPRQPCHKLNHRFHLKNFAPETYRTSRTGWYYRVLREGTVQAGDEIRLVERGWPQWTVERVQEFMHRSPDNAAMNEALAALGVLGDEMRNAFAARVAKLRAKQRREARDASEWRDYRLVEKTAQTPRITSFVFEAVAPEPDVGAELLEHGVHVRLRLPNGLVRSYSVVSGSQDRFELGVALDAQSRGGSAYLHHQAKQGDIIQAGRVTSAGLRVMAANKHVFIVGGIGITAFLSLAERFRKINFDTELHYAVRSADDVPFRSRVLAMGDSLRLYDASRGERMDIPALLRGLTWNSFVYVCGPRRMMDVAAEEAKRCGLAEDEIHFEAFSADATGDPFEVEVANRGGQVLKVEGEESLLDVLRRQFDVPSSCEVGNCGTCKLVLRSGVVEHRGSALLEEEKKGALLGCVSRGIGRISIEI
ncbi:PK beta-barrel-protein domain-containing protein-like protein [Xylaria intraflava]|nr:PK beta-barrel-protein domain-containing protein-like protein [Xylaria intraflava]